MCWKRMNDCISWVAGSPLCEELLCSLFFSKGCHVDIMSVNTCMDRQLAGMWCLIDSVSNDGPYMICE